MTSSSAPSLRLGTVPYLNARPLVEGLAERPGVSLVEDVPARLAGRLREGELDAALVSSVELFRGAPLGWVPGPAVTSNGPVLSIRLYLRTPLEQVQTLALDTSSLSAATMARVCFAEFLGRDDVTLQDADPGAPLDSIDADAILRIGDPALLTPPGARECIDLGALWTERTGLPFVYALWLAPEGTSAAPLTTLLDEARSTGLEERGAIARRFARMHCIAPALCVDYLQAHLAYDMGPREREGLALFGKLAARHGLVDRAELPPPLAD